MSETIWELTQLQSKTLQICPDESLSVVFPALLTEHG